MSNSVNKSSSQLATHAGDLFGALYLLVKPADQGSKGELHDILELNLKNALQKLKIERLGHLDTLISIKCPVSSASSVRWRFVCLCLHVLLSLKKNLNQQVKLEIKEGKDKEKKPNHPSPDILSVSQQKVIKTCLQFVVSIGLLPSLLPGVGIALGARCTNAQALKEEELVDLDKYERLASVTRGIVACCDQPSLRSVILPHHLGDLLAALAQLSFVPLKRPSDDQNEGDTEESIITPILWDRLQVERKHFQKCFLSFVSQVYQPLIIRELLLLQGASEFVGTSRITPPQWLKRVCIQQLVHCLTKSGGVSALMRALCDLIADTGADWQKLDKVVRIIIHVHTLNAEEYYSNICAQLIDILSMDHKNHTNIYVTIATLCIKSLYEKKPLMCMRYALDVMMKPLLMCADITCNGPVLYREIELLPKRLEALSATRDESSDTVVVVTEEEISHSIVLLHKCFVMPESGFICLPIDLLATVIPILFRLHQKIYLSASYLKKPVQELLLKFMITSKQFSLREMYGNALFNDKVEDTLQFSEKLEFDHGPTGGVQVRLRTQTLDSLLVSEEAGDSLLELFDEGDEGGELTNSLFIALLHVLTQKSEDPEERVRSIEVCDSMGNHIPFSGHSDKSIVAVKLLAILAESPLVQEQIVTDPSHVIHFIKYMLERDANFLLKDDPDNTDKDLDLESLFLVLMVLSVVINDPSTSSAKWEPFKELVKPLKIIRQTVTNEELKRFADKLYNTIVTQGVIRESTAKLTQKQKKRLKDKKLKKEKNGRRQQKGKVSEPSSVNVKSNSEQKKKPSSPAVSEQDLFSSCAEEEELEFRLDSPELQTDWKKLSRCEQALFDACDPLLPVRGHALIEFSKLVAEGDKEALQHRNHIIRIFQENIKHDDSFIYLAAINGLATMATYIPNTILKILIEEFNDIRERRSDPEDELINLKMKIGEVLVRVIRSLGEILPHYKSMLINTFLNGAKDPDPFVRASSLSNLGEVCKVLGFRVGPIINELLLCVRNIVMSDPVPEVRRAAALLVTLLLQGLGSDTLKVLESALLELYRSLKMVHKLETDDVVKLHVQLALDELNRSTIDYLFPQPKLEKKIYVLDPPET